MLKCALIFGNDMVLQRDKEVPVWGVAEPLTQVEVSIQGHQVSTVSDEQGAWKVTLPSLATSFAEVLDVHSGEETLTFTGVQVGEVWLAGGQSNMEFHMRYDADYPAEKENCTSYDIRFFDYLEVSYPEQLNEADFMKCYGFWRRSTPDQLERFSAVGYYFAKELQANDPVPVGIIGCNWGGTPACAWMSEQAVRNGGGQVYLDEYNAAVENLDLDAYEEAFRRNPMSYRVDQLADPISDLMMYGCTMEEFMGKLAEMGIDLSKMDPSAFMPPVGPKYERRPCGLYESMLKPLSPYAIRGVIWYQGETDGDGHPEAYETLFPALIKNWRALWKEDLPFFFVQLAPLEQWMACVGEPYVIVREAQQHTADTVPGTGMAVITDVGMQHDIHPKKKQPVGRRLALLAENKVYGKDILCEAPTLVSAAVSSGKIDLKFDHAGDGLVLKVAVPYGQVVGETHLGGLQIFQDGKELSADLLAARAEKNTVTVTSPEIKEGVPTEIRIAKTGWYLVNLYNSNDIPARPATLTI
ncbi:MAG: hypothetical protein IJ744_08825 [Lachnospiraceae bacterium]|nr:hypothetical protein [Lachnospiraceae bacterium]